MEINFRAEFEDTPIRHLAVQCPKCNNWFKAYDVTLYPNNAINSVYDIYGAEFECPVCQDTYEVDNTDFSIVECSYHEVYKNCITKKIGWSIDE